MLEPSVKCSSGTSVVVYETLTGIDRIIPSFTSNGSSNKSC